MPQGKAGGASKAKAKKLRQKPLKIKKGRKNLGTRVMAGRKGQMIILKQKMDKEFTANKTREIEGYAASKLLQTGASIKNLADLKSAGKATLQDTMDAKKKKERKLQERRSAIQAAKLEASERLGEFIR
eukprot:TRINITY_DN785_c0_g1_i2.p1 TRINITY_DN785_c0_g1~~TRINITY_DN785_c0_g1_i2.p1  ORF type:complete len:129 (-),score=29.72 TRINITY_DN785_c0_g1_i2:313-699(-)